MWSGLQAHDGRKDNVASPDKQGKCHKTECQDVLAFQHFHYEGPHGIEIRDGTSPMNGADAARRRKTWQYLAKRPS
ncbi:hypothetical protein ALP66_103575 [Pseudomonas amygdali pv. photiniae]|uniref:Uncharacterized protein n=1 Tax=Pseudomonas amygdali pv. photiniae TaxID=251724 RepID=A0A658K4Q8_PSEA0|nr:hypothetical protein ALP66_103575 [Pseudomonas amygdali pv. photiniae]